jgi:hypothetical protein
LVEAPVRESQPDAAEAHKRHFEQASIATQLMDLQHKDCLQGLSSSLPTRSGSNL